MPAPDLVTWSSGRFSIPRLPRATKPYGFLKPPILPSPPSRLWICLDSGQIFQITHPRHIVIMERVKQLAAHFAGTSGVHALEVKRPDDVVITLAIRSPLCKAKKGGFKDAR